MNLHINLLIITLKISHCNPNKGSRKMAFTSVRSLKAAVHYLLLLALILAFSNAYGLPAGHDTAIPGELHHLTVLFTNDCHGHPVKFSTHSVPDVAAFRPVPPWWNKSEAHARTYFFSMRET